MKNLVKHHRPLVEKFFRTPVGYQMGLRLREMHNRPDATDGDLRMVYDDFVAELTRWVVNSPHVTHRNN
jgi:hypothetical protein